MQSPLLSECIYQHLTSDFTQHKSLRHPRTMSTPTSDRKWACGFCQLAFPTKGKRESHKRSQHPQCSLCCKRFRSLKIIRNHKAQTSHCFCSHCNIHFSTVEQHIQHARDISHPAQYSCCDCGREYPNDDYLERHCCHCDQVYRSRARLKRHFRSHSDHRPSPNIARIEDPATLQHECSKCEAKFATKKLLKAHKRSHKPPRIIPCPTGGRCQKKFATPSALLSHLESGKCPSGITRAKLNAMVMSNDIEGCVVDHTAIGDVVTPG